MAKKPLNLEELAELRKCPYIASVMSGKITFTPEFKRVAHEQLVFGKPMRTILEEHGIDPDILGNARIYGMAHMLRQGASCETGFTDLRKQNRRRPAENTKEQSLTAKVRQLEHEIAYMKQEVEFLKKIRMADLEAQKQWESKQRRK